MSRSNKSNGRKKLFKSDSETRCSSSSSSSNSEDGDVVIRKASSYLTTSPLPPPTTSTTTTTTATRALNSGASLRGGSEAPPADLVYEYLTRDLRGREPSAADSLRSTNLKIVRIRKFRSNESKVLLIVDVPPSARRHQHHPHHYRRLQQQHPQQQQQQPQALQESESGQLQSPSAQLPLAVAPESNAGRNVGPENAPVDVFSLEIGSREIFELSDELAKKFDVDDEMKSFEWRSFSRPDDVIRLLLNDGGSGGGAKPMVVGGSGGGGGGHDKLVVGLEAGEKSPMIMTPNEERINAKKHGTGGGSGGGSGKPPALKKKRVSVAVDRQLAVATGFDNDDDGSYSLSINGGATNHLRSRTVRTPLGKDTVLDATAAALRRSSKAGPAAVVSAASASPTTAAAAAAATADSLTEATLTLTNSTNKYRDTMVDDTWKLLKNHTTLRRRENVDNLRVLLGEDNVKGISNCGADTSASDAIDDTLNSSNGDDSDAKAKKKNRCALCRKKVGLTGFECRCGGLYCGMHRYSDKHNCTFDYRQLGAQEIRRNNPVVIGEKIQKI